MRDTEVTEIWNKLLTKPIQMMTEQERIVHAVNVFLVEFELGGWLYNLAPDASESQQSWAGLRGVAAAVATIGASSVAERLTEIAAIVERAPPQPTSGTWKHFLEGVDPQRRISGLEREIGAELNVMYGLLEAYTLAQLTNPASGDQ